MSGNEVAVDDSTAHAPTDPTVPPLPGATMTLAELAAQAHVSVCSRPPPPITNTTILHADVATASVLEAVKKMTRTTRSTARHSTSI